MRGPSLKTIGLIVFARRLLAQHHPMTLRQLHYAVFSAAAIPYENTKQDYQRLGRVTTRARRDYRALELDGEENLHLRQDLIPPNWIIDELREADRANVWKDAAGYMESVKACYRRDNWQDQPEYCEVWSEKATVLASLRPVTRSLGVTLRACRGFASTGMEGQVGYLFEGIAKPITVFFLGDHDPSGHDIERDIYRRAQEASGKEFEMIRLAIHAKDIKEFNLPPQRIKASDSRSAGFRKRFGTSAATVELDALPVEELRQRVKNAIHELIDAELWSLQVTVQAVELKSIADFADAMKKLKQVGAS